MTAPPPLGTRATQTLSSCCGMRGGVFAPHPNPAIDSFQCSHCKQVYTFEYVMDYVLDLAAKPVPPPKMNPKVTYVPLSRSLNTYPVKEELKTLGAKWDALNKQWLVPDSAFQQAHVIIKRGVANTTPPASAWTSSRFGGLADDDEIDDSLSGKGFAPWNWRDNSTQKPGAPPQIRLEQRTCWECGKAADHPTFTEKGGSWDDYWCGCEGR